MVSSLPTSVCRRCGIKYAPELVGTLDVFHGLVEWGDSNYPVPYGLTEEEVDAFGRTEKTENKDLPFEEFDLPW